MAGTKYGDMVKAIPVFKDLGYGNMRQAAEMDADFFGYDLNVTYGTYDTAGPVEPHVTQVCDYDQVQLWIGTDTYDLGYLGAQIEFCMGEEKERHRITTSTGLRIPKGVPFGPGRIGPMDDRFIRMNISMTSRVGGKSVLADNPDGPYAPGLGGVYRKYFGNGLAFTRNGPWHYGPNNPDTHDGAITEIEGVGFDFHMSYESMNKAPYRFSPNPDKPHVHPYTEFLVFMGCDCEDLSYFPAEVELCMGPDMETHMITEPTIAIQPKGHPHIPVRVLRQEEPWIFMVIRPWGHMGQLAPAAAPPSSAGR